MQFPAKIIKIGSSKGITIPKKVVELLGLQEGDYVIVEIRKAKVVAQ